MKKKLLCIATSAMMVSMMTTGFAFTDAGILKTSSATSTSTSLAAEKVINVTGIGELKVDPDVAYVQLGVTTQKKTSKEARNENAKTIEKIKTALKKAGVKEEDIQTQYVNAYTTSDYSTPIATLAPGETMNAPTMVYVVNTQLKVSVRDLNKLGSTVNSALNAGATDLSGVNFSIEDPEKYYGQLVDKAMKSAQDKAKTIAKASGTTLGTIVSTYDQTYMYGLGDAYDRATVTSMGGTTTNTEATEKDSNLGDALRPEKVSLSVQLNVTYSAK